MMNNTLVVAKGKRNKEHFFFQKRKIYYKIKKIFSVSHEFFETEINGSIDDPFYQEEIYRSFLEERLSEVIFSPYKLLFIGEIVTQNFTYRLSFDYQNHTLIYEYSLLSNELVETH